MVKAGLILQACLLKSFIILQTIFQVRARQRGILSKNLKVALIALYVSCTILTARCIYRILEFFLGYSGYISTHKKRSSGSSKQAHVHQHSNVEHLPPRPLPPAVEQDLPIPRRCDRAPRTWLGKQVVICCDLLRSFRSLRSLHWP